MNVTGYDMREAIRRWELLVDATEREFNSALLKFEDETKRHPKEIAAVFSAAEHAIARIQVAQTRYNLLVSIDVLGKSIPLAEAVKRLGGIGRLEKMWRKAAGEKTRRDFYTRDDARETTRKKDEETARPQVTTADAVKEAAEVARLSGALRAGIARGNNTEIDADLLSLDPALLRE